MAREHIDSPPSAALTSTLEDAPAIALLQGADLAFVYASASFRALLGGADLIGSPFAEVWASMSSAGERNIRLALSPLPGRETSYVLVQAQAPDEESFTERRVAEASASLLSGELARTRRLQERTALLREVAAAAASSTDLSELSRSTLSVARERLGAESAIVFHLEGSRLRQVASFGVPAEVHGVHDLGEGSPIGHAIRLGRLTHQDTLSPEATEMVEGMGMSDRSWVVVPMESNGAIIGGLGLSFADHRPFSEEEVSLFDDIARQLADSTERVLLFEELRETTRLGDALNDINEVLHGAMDRTEIMRRSVLLADEVLVSDVCLALEIPEEEPVVVECSGLRLSTLGPPGNVLGSAWLSQWVLQHNDVLPVDDVALDRRVDGERLDELGIASVLVLPLKVRRRTFGALLFGFRELHPFTDAEVDFAQKLASAVSLALESARLYENERFIAETLQESLLSLPDEIEGLQIAHLYSSATDTARVGGDFYDVFELAHGNVGVLIGDVSGKGVDAAVLTSLVKNTLRAHAMTRGRTPAQVVSLTSQAVYRETRPEAFVTLLFGILDRRDGRFVYCNAAHTSACLRRTTGETHALRSTSPIVGAFPDAAFCEAETYLDFGDELWLYTDGLTEARVGPVQFGEERLMRTLRESTGQSLDRRLGDLLGEVVKYTQGHLVDDIALLVIRRTGQPETALQQKFDPREFWG